MFQEWQHVLSHKWKGAGQTEQQNRDLRGWGIGAGKEREQAGQAGGLCSRFYSLF